MSDSNSDVSAILENLSVCQSLVRKPEEPAVAIRLLTNELEIIAECDLKGYRLSDVLNQTISDYLVCKKASVLCRGKVIARVDSLKVRKPEILLAGIVGDHYEAKDKRLGSRRRLEQFDAFVAVDRWVITGRLYLTSKKDVKEFLQSNLDFFPIADAQMVDGDCPENPCETSVVVVNRSHVALMEITDPPEPADDDREIDLHLIFDEQSIASS